VLASSLLLAPCSWLRYSSTDRLSFAAAHHPQSASGSPLLAPQTSQLSDDDDHLHLHHTSSSDEEDHMVSDGEPSSKTMDHDHLDQRKGITMTDTAAQFHLASKGGTAPDQQRNNSLSNESNGDEEPTGQEAENTEADGLLPRDKQRRTAFYDYTSDRQTSQMEAKQFFQQHQQDALPSMDSFSPILRAKTMTPDVGDGLSRTESVRSRSSTIRRDTQSTKSARGPPGIAYQEPAATVADQAARTHALHPNLPHEYKPPLLATEGIHGAGAGVGLGNGAGGFAPSDAQVTAELATIYGNIQRVLEIRRKYIQLSLQGPFDNPKDQEKWNIYPPPFDPHWDTSRNAAAQGSLANSTTLESPGQQQEESRDTKPASKQTRKPGQDIGEDFDFDDLLPLPGTEGATTYKLDETGIFQVYDNEAAKMNGQPRVEIPGIREFYMDLELILDVSSDGPSKSFAFRRLQYLEGKFNLYILLNEYQEMADSKRVPHRDFYNVRKVDTHVHHSACMNQKHLLRFIKSKMRKSPDELVLFRDDKYLTLKEVFESINLTAYDLSIDTLDMHVRTGSQIPSCTR
jgi:AMP deaminase